MALCSIGDACKLVGGVATNGDGGGGVLSHLHFYGVRGKMAGQLKQHLAESLNSLGVEFVSFNCITFDVASRMLNEIFTALHGYSSTDWVVIVLTKAEEMGRFKFELLRSGFSQLRQKRNLILVTMSEKPWGKIESDSFRVSLSNPLQHFIVTEPGRNADSSVTFNALCAAHPNVSAGLIRTVLGTSDMHFNDYDSLTYIIDWLCKQCELGGIDPKSANPSDPKVSALCRAIKNDAAFSLHHQFRHQNQSSNVDYPVQTRLVIMAAYCASYNPTSSDQRFFSKGGSQARKRKHVAGRDREKFHETGPRAFDYRRITLIYLHFWNTYEKDPQADYPSGAEKFDMSGQLRMLIADGIVASVSAPDNLDEPKFRCLCSLEFVERICKSVDSKLDFRHDYLLDFAEE